MTTKRADRGSTQRPSGRREAQGGISASFSAWLCVLGVSAFVVSAGHAATNDLSATLQRGLFEEEANRNLDAAAQAYQTVSAQFDKDRQLAATAIFRLGEIYRKQNKTNEAAAQYERIVREFADQDTLVMLSRQNLTGLLGALKPTPGQTAASVLSGGIKLESMRTELVLLKAQLDAARKETNVTRVMHLFSIPPEHLNSFGGFGREEQLQQLFAYQELRVRSLESALAQTQNQNGNVPPPDADANLLAQLKKLSRAELREVLPSISGDKVLTELIQQLNSAEAKFKELARDVSEGHPEYQRSIAVQKLLNEKIDARLDGIMKAMEIRVSASMVSGTPQGGENNPEAAVTDEEEKEIRRIQEIVRNSPDLINAPSGDPSMTPLCRAAKNGQLRVAKFLLEGSAAIDRRSSGATPLHYAAAAGHRAMVEFLLQRGADVNARNTQGQTALHLAAENGFQSVAEVLVTAKTDVNAIASKQETPLFLAAGKGHAELVKFLIAKGAQLDAKDEQDFTAVTWAARRGHSETLTALLAAKANPDVLSREGRTPLSYAAEAGHLDSVKALLAAKADPNVGRTTLPLHAAIHRKSPLLVEALLRADADANRMATIIWQLSADGTIYGSRGAYPSLTPLFLAIKESNLESVKLLLQFKADPNEVGPNGVPLIFSVLDQPEMLKAFLDAGANPNPQPPPGYNSPLAATSNAESVALLLAKGADIETSGYGNTPLLTQIEWGRADVVEALLKAGASVRARKPDGQTALHLATSLRNLDMVSALLAYKADVNARDKNGLTPLDLVSGTRKQLKWVNGQSYQFNDLALTDKTAALLREHGGLSDLPKVDCIEVRRPDSGYSKTIFAKGTNDWNHYTLLDTLFGNYFSGELSLPGVMTRPASLVERMPLFRPSPSVAEPPFPDLRRIVVVRPSAKPGEPARRIVVDLLLPTGGVDCAKDVPLEFGDVVEIPEREHTLQENAVGLTAEELLQIARCREGTVGLLVRGKRTDLKVAPWSPDASIGPVLARQEARSALFSSSDLSRVKVKRPDAATGKAREWLIDCSAGKSPDLWLRNGDVIDVPDKP